MIKLDIQNINVKDIRAYYDDKTKTETKETDFMLFYKTQVFNCTVDIELPESIADRDWDIGLVQACDYLYLSNSYGKIGNSLWEFHPLKLRLRNLINDSDGRQYPFYSLNQSVLTIRRGPVEARTVTLQIKDYFHPSVIWDIPYNNKVVYLSEINRQQKFHIWLIAIKYGKRFSKDEIFVLNRIRWEYNLHLHVDYHMPIGERVRKIYDAQDPYIDIHDVRDHLDTQIPDSATKAPHCNAAQSLIWYPHDCFSEPGILVPPKQIIVPWEQWLSDMFGKPNIKFKKPRDTCVI